jgi:hypothetical protein
MGQTTKVKGVATSVRVDGNSTIVRYHNTDVVVFDSETITLDCGGWKTVTTKTRMNQASHEFNLGYHVYSLKKEWIVFHIRKTIPFDGDKIILKR